ncbi:glutathione S-transferase family protein [Parasphingopyxis sp. GrpM-11]|uniref:Glutathione S-transferase family protein n=2 Tax=Parasphingopyxis marina TaxID=2761622 RepID=A0A842I053_9SPHN|nr:glutathione S-transferase family protein [Parasphingopyxis marina]
MTLYHGEPNGPSLTVLAALYETGLDADLVPIDLSLGERHRKAPLGVESAMSIEGEGPVLEVNGEAMADSVFLAQYLDERAGGAGLQPSDPLAHWEMMMWCRYIIERVAPAAAYLGNRAHGTARLKNLDGPAFDMLTDAISSVDLKQRWIDIRNGDFDEAKVADSATKISEAVDKLEERLADGRDWLMGDFSIADLESYAWLAGMVSILPSAFDRAENATAWMVRVKARPSVAAALACAQSDDPTTAWAPGPEINRWG